MSQGSTLWRICHKLRAVLQYPIHVHPVRFFGNNLLCHGVVGRYFPDRMLYYYFIHFPSTSSGLLRSNWLHKDCFWYAITCDTWRNEKLVTWNWRRVYDYFLPWHSKRLSRSTCMANIIQVEFNMLASMARVYTSLSIQTLLALPMHHSAWTISIYFIRLTCKNPSNRKFNMFCTFLVFLNSETQGLNCTNYNEVINQ